MAQRSTRVLVLIIMLYVIILKTCYGPNNYVTCVLVLLILLCIIILVTMLCYSSDNYVVHYVVDN